MTVYIVQWVDEFNRTRYQKFYDKKKADNFADEIFLYYPVTTFTRKENN